MNLNLYTCESDLDRFLRENRVGGLRDAVTCSGRFNRISKFRPDYSLVAVEEAMGITTYPIQNVCVTSSITRPEPEFTTKLYGKAILSSLALLKQAKMEAINNKLSNELQMVKTPDRCPTVRILDKVAEAVNESVSNRHMTQDNLNNILSGYRAFYNVEQTPIPSDSVLWTGLDAIRKENRLTPFQETRIELSQPCGDIPAEILLESLEYIGTSDGMETDVPVTKTFYEGLNDFITDDMMLKTQVVAEKFDSLTYDEIFDRAIIDAQVMVEKSAVPVDVDSVTFNVSESHAGQLDELRLKGCKFFKMSNDYHGDRIVIESEGTPYLLFGIRGHNALFGYDIDNGTKLMRISDTENVNESTLDISANIFGGED